MYVCNDASTINYDQVTTITGVYYNLTFLFLTYYFEMF